MIELRQAALIQVFAPTPFLQKTAGVHAKSSCWTHNTDLNVP